MDTVKLPSATWVTAKVPDTATLGVTNTFMLDFTSGAVTMMLLTPTGMVAEPMVALVMSGLSTTNARAFNVSAVSKPVLSTASKVLPEAVAILSTSPVKPSPTVPAMSVPVSILLLPTVTPCAALTARAVRRPSYVTWNGWLQIK